MEGFPLALARALQSRASAVERGHLSRVRHQFDLPTAFQLPDGRTCAREHSSDHPVPAVPAPDYSCRQPDGIEGLGSPTRPRHPPGSPRSPSPTATASTDLPAGGMKITCSAGSPYLLFC